LRDAIRNGEFADGQQLPTEEQLAARHSVSRQTVRRAMQDLVSEGIIYRVAGRGTYPVAEADRYLRHFGSVEDLMALSLDTDCEIVTPLRHVVDVEGASRLRSIKGAEQSITAAAPPSAADHLDCAPGQPVLRIDRLYTDDADTPVELAVSYFDPAHYSYRVRLHRGPS
jgi:DNA-binding GntR family transcriptional regulator